MRILVSLCRPMTLLWGISIVAICNGFTARFFKQTAVRLKMGIVELVGEEANEGLPRLSPTRRELIRWIDAAGNLLVTARLILENNVYIYFNETRYFEII